MCGKPNPADAEVCRYCHARLKPIQPGDLPQPKPTGALEAMLPPWIRELRAESEMEEETLPLPGEKTEADGSEGAFPEGESASPEPDADDPLAALWAEEEEDEDLPDWLKSLGTEEEASAVAALAEEQAAPSAGEPPEAAEPKGAAEEEESALPDWLAGEQSAAEAEEAVLPDWLAEGVVAEPAGEPAEAAAPKGAAEEEENALPDGSVGAYQPPLVEAPSESLSASPFVESEELAEALLGETPDWLQMLAPEEESASGEKSPAEEEVAQPLTEGELPSWLEALRPVAAATSVLATDEEEPVETQGPLAGLRGVIAPPTLTTLRPGKVGVLGGKLKLSDEEERQARILQDLIAESSRPLPPSSLPDKKEQKVLRWSVGLLMLLAAFLPFFLPFLRAPLPRRVLPAAIAAQRLIDDVPQGAPVLVAVDYSPAFSAEMEAAAAPLVTDLLAKHARIVAVSTQPTGPDLISHFFAALGSDYRESEHYLNLGYLSGGTAGLYAFARHPRLVFGYAAGHDRIWNTSFLSTIHTAADFSLVLVIAEDPETARAWVEQVRPALGEHTPLLMVISTQAEPLVEPYYETASQQVGGIVTGIVGGLAYEAIRGRPLTAAAQAQWGAYSNIALMGLMIIAGAGLVNLVLGWRERRNAPTLPQDEDLDDEEA